ncbi:BRE1 E3 ubiquitin ligase-domain-containing protein [Geopyxis carbonaria]|nr:BRE1 E3 ubiquitin ligase-domain-containing protein [Geopyxis carbonaria]
MKSTSVIVMEDRKRSVPHDPSEDANPPFKRQAMQSSSQHPNSSHQVPQTQEDVIHFQKEAIWRQMQEYKRERNVLEARIEELDKRSAYHDDHLRVMDAWWTQLLDEVRLIAGDADSGAHMYQNGDSLDFPLSLLFDDVATFAEHLKDKRDQITASLKKLFQTIKAGAPLKSESDKIDELQARIRHLLVNEKANKVEISRLEKEVEGASARLTEATVKYLTAEKKLDRLKSQTLAKIERQAMFNSNTHSEPKKESEEQSAKDREISAKVAEGHVADVEQARREAQAIASKQKEEIQQLQADNTRLSEQVTKFTIKFGRLSEDDISSCDAFKNLKVRLDDIATRYSHIEALNRELSERAELLESERTSFKETILEEQQSAISEIQAQLSKTEQDLARIRSARDDLLQDQALRKAKEEVKISSINAVNELAEARAMRIEALELEVDRLKNISDQGALMSEPNIAALNIEQLRQKYEQLDKAYKVLSQELPGLEQAFKKAHELGNKKVLGLQETEEKLKRLLAEKNKADQKYFTAMKAKDALQNEARALKSQNSKSTEIITQLKEAEKRIRDLMCNLEKQLAELKASNNAILVKNRELQCRVVEQSNTIDSMKSQILELGNSLRQRDSALSRESSSRREAEIECEKLHVKIDEADRVAESNKPQDAENAQLEALRQIALCAVCRNRFKNTAIKNCGHVFCRQCADERIASRSRKCPNCGRAFAATDLISVHL